MAVIPGRTKREPQMCDCTSGNLEIPDAQSHIWSLVLAHHPGMTSWTNRK
jgi:hypothetical protein